MVNLNNAIGELKNLQTDFNADFQRGPGDFDSSKFGGYSITPGRPSNYYGDWDLDNWKKEKENEWQPKIDDWGRTLTPYIPPKNTLDPAIEEAIKKILEERLKATSIPKKKSPLKPKKITGLKDLISSDPDDIFNRMVKKALDKIKKKK